MVEKWEYNWKINIYIRDDIETLNKDWDQIEIETK